MKTLAQRFDERMFGLVDPEVRDRLIPSLIKIVEEYNEELMNETIKAHCQDEKCVCKTL